MNSLSLPPQLRPFADLIARAQRGELDTGALLLPLGNKRFLITWDANRVIRRNVAQVLDDPLLWRVDACVRLLALIQQHLCAPVPTGYKTPQNSAKRRAVGCG